MNRLKFLGIPYLIWMIILVVLPTLIIIFMGFTDYDIYKGIGGTFDLSTLDIFNDTVVIRAIENSIKLSVMATLICLLIGYPVAYYLSSIQSKYKTFIVSLIILPIWSNMLLRIIAFEIVFFPNSILNMFGISFDLIGTNTAILIGMTSMYLPFMVLPIYTVLEKMDKRLVEASSDLGASRFQTFYKVVFPLSISGVVSGVIMTLLPAMTAFALPERLSGGKTLLIGNIIENYVFGKGDQSGAANLNAASMISFVLLIVIVILFMQLLKADKEGETLI